MMTEQEAIQRLKQGDIAGLEMLVRVYQVQAVRAAALITRDRTLAEDLVQAAFIRAYERIHQFDAARPFGPWFLRSVVNDAVKAITRGIPAESLNDPPPDLLPALADPAPGPEEMLEQAETSAAIQAALEQLAPEQRGAVVLRYYLDLSEAEIAGAQDCPTGTVKWRLHHARARLRSLLDPWPHPQPDSYPPRSQGESL